jgi:hypothetical protein
MNSIKAPPGFFKHTGSQHWDSTVNVRVGIVDIVNDTTLTLRIELSSPIASTLQHYHVRGRAADHHSHPRSGHAK